jgi:hypothetical protein
MNFNSNYDPNNNSKLEPLYHQVPDKEMAKLEARKLKSLMPDEKGYSIIGRLYKKSCSRLRECMVEPDAIRLVDELVPPDAAWSLAWTKKRDYERMLRVVEAAMEYAPIADATARKEFVAYQTVLSRKRVKVTTKVAEVLKKSADIKTRFEQKHDDLVEKLLLAENTKKPRIKNYIQRLTDTFRREAEQAAKEVVEAQREEEYESVQIKGAEETCIKHIKHWRPQHGKLYDCVKLVKFRLVALIELICAHIIQRTARRKLLMYCRGEPDDEFAREMMVRVKKKKIVIYQPRPW